MTIDDDFLRRIVLIRTDKDEVGVGFLASKNRLLTCWHVLDRASYQAAEAGEDLGLPSGLGVSITHQNRELSPKHFVVGSKQVSGHSGVLDAAVVHVDSAPPVPHPQFLDGSVEDLERALSDTEGYFSIACSTQSKPAFMRLTKGHPSSILQFNNEPQFIDVALPSSRKDLPILSGSPLIWHSRGRSRIVGIIVESSATTIRALATAQWRRFLSHSANKLATELEIHRARPQRERNEPTVTHDGHFFAMGQPTATQAPRPVTSRIVDWLLSSPATGPGDDAPHKGLFALTGIAGCGKSIILAQLHELLRSQSFGGLKVFSYSFYENPEPHDFWRYLSQWLGLGSQSDPISESTLNGILSSEPERRLLILDGAEFVTDPDAAGERTSSRDARAQGYVPRGYMKRELQSLLRATAQGTLDIKIVLTTRYSDPIRLTEPGDMESLGDPVKMVNEEVDFLGEAEALAILRNFSSFFLEPPTDWQARAFVSHHGLHALAIRIGLGLLLYQYNGDINRYLEEEKAHSAPATIEYGRDLTDLENHFAGLLRRFLSLIEAFDPHLLRTLQHLALLQGRTSPEELARLIHSSEVSTKTPLLYRGDFDTARIDEWLAKLEDFGLIQQVSIQQGDTVSQAHTMHLAVRGQCLATLYEACNRQQRHQDPLIIEPDSSTPGNSRGWQSLRNPELPLPFHAGALQFLQNATLSLGRGGEFQLALEIYIYRLGGYEHIGRRLAEFRLGCDLTEGLDHEIGQHWDELLAACPAYAIRFRGDLGAFQRECGKYDSAIETYVSNEEIFSAHDLPPAIAQVQQLWVSLILGDVRSSFGFNRSISLSKLLAKLGPGGEKSRYASHIESAYLRGQAHNYALCGKVEASLSLFRQLLGAEAVNLTPSRKINTAADAAEEGARLAAMRRTAFTPQTRRSATDRLLEALGRHWLCLLRYRQGHTEAARQLIGQNRHEIELVLGGSWHQWAWRVDLLDMLIRIQEQWKKPTEERLKKIIEQAPTVLEHMASWARTNSAAEALCCTYQARIQLSRLFNWNEENRAPKADIATSAEYGIFLAKNSKLKIHEHDFRVELARHLLTEDHPARAEAECTQVLKETQVHPATGETAIPSLYAWAHQEALALRSTAKLHLVDQGAGDRVDRERLHAEAQADWAACRKLREQLQMADWMQRGDITCPVHMPELAETQ